MLAIFTYLLSLARNWKHFRKWNYSVFTSVSTLQSTARFYQKPFKKKIRVRACVYKFFFNRFLNLTKVNCSMQIIAWNNFNMTLFSLYFHSQRLELSTNIFILKLVICTHLISTNLLCGQRHVFKPFGTFPCSTHRWHMKWLTKDWWVVFMIGLRLENKC